MYLSNKDILEAVNSKQLTLKNFDINRLQVASYDVKLGNRFKVFNTENGQLSDPFKKISPEERDFTVKNGDPVYLLPSQYLLAETADYVGSENLLIHINGKSSLARIGLMIHNTAGIVNPGHFLKIVLELSNQSNVPIILRPGMEIAQLLFSKLSSKPTLVYNSEYAHDNWKVNKHD